MLTQPSYNPHAKRQDALLNAHKRFLAMEYPTEYYNNIVIPQLNELLDEYDSLAAAANEWRMT